MYSYLKSLFLCSLAKFVQLMALCLSLSLFLSLSLKKFYSMPQQVNKHMTQMEIEKVKKNLNN